MTSISDPLLAQLVGDLDTRRRALADALAAIPVADRDRRPGEGRWSVAEVLGHLNIVESRVTALFKQLVAATPARDPAVVPDASIGAVDLDRLLDRSRKIAAPAPLHPVPGPNADAAWEQLVRTRESFRAALVEADGRDLSAISRTHLVLGELNGYQWVASLAGHEARHTLQIREIGETLAAA